MAKKTKILPKRQAQLSQTAIDTYNNAQKQPTPDVVNTNRGYHRSVKNDNVKQFSIGLKDIDETIVYFNNLHTSRIESCFLYSNWLIWVGAARSS